MKNFYTLRDLAQYLKISIPTIWRWRRDDSIPTNTRTSRTLP